MLDEFDLVPALLERLHASPPAEALVFCRRLLSITLAGGFSPFAWDVLSDIAEHDALWQSPELPRLLAQYGVPSDRESLRQQSCAHAGTQPRILLSVSEDRA